VPVPPPGCFGENLTTRGGACGFDDTAWVKRFTADGRPGP
jgi:hypothetical protein